MSLTLVRDGDAAELLATRPAVLVARARELLGQAVDACDVGWLQRMKSDAAQIETLVRERDLGVEARTAADELVVRVVRALATVVRAGQEEGTVPSPGRPGENDAQSIIFPKPIEVFGHERTRGDAYVMADVDDETFDRIITEVKAERNAVPRAAVVRKAREVLAARVEPAEEQPVAQQQVSRTREAVAARVERARELASQSFSSRQIAKELGMGVEGTRALCRSHGIDVPADRSVGRSRALDWNRVVTATVDSLPVAHDSMLASINFTALDGQRLPEWVELLNGSLRTLTALRNNLKKEIDRRASR